MSVRIILLQGYLNQEEAGAKQATQRMLEARAMLDDAKDQRDLALYRAALLRELIDEGDAS